MASRLQDVILRGLASAKPVASTVAPGTLYHSSDTAITERSNGTLWESYADASTGGAPGAHHLSHQVGGTDIIDVTQLGGFPGGTSNFLRADGTFAASGVAAHAATHASGGSDPVTITEAQVTNLVTDLAAKAPSVHGLNHASAGSDPVNINSLAGYPGGTTNFLRADGTFATPASSRIVSFGMIIDGGASVLTTGLKGYLEIPFACTLQSVTLLADVSGSIVVDIWKDTYAAYPPVVADTITAAAKPTITTALKSQDLVLTGWNKIIVAGDILAFNVDSVTSIKKVTLSLKALA